MIGEDRTHWQQEQKKRRRTASM